MKNKVDLKKYLIFNTFLLIILTIIFTIINIKEHNTYKQNTNDKISAIISLIEKEYPNIEKREIINILNSKEELHTNTLKEYGIDIVADSIILQNDIKQKEFIILNCIFMLITLILLTTTFLVYLNKKDKKIKEITHLIENINNKIYTLEIETTSEDELSILKNELYKTTILLKEQAENSLKDKISIKESIEDISHQLKTPLTSIMISLDNLIDNPEMDENTKNEFLYTIKRETSNINFLIISILKLSKFDTNTVQYKTSYTQLYKILEESKKNVSMICDLKNIQININSPKNIKIKCDSKWQTEAITNILKNAVEHSPKNSKISISTEQNKLYTTIKITNEGTIDKQDLPHIFERFYKGKDSSPDSIGIGLALSKSIIEKDNGKITAETNKETTTFTIKYFNE